MDATEIVTGLNPACAADAAFSIYLQIAINTISAAYFQKAVDNSELAIAYKTMHIWTLAQRPLAEAGAVSGKGEGQLNISFISTALQRGITNSNLQQTHWGMQLLDLIKQQGPAIGIISAAPSAGDYYSPQDLTDIALQLLSYD